MDFIPTLYYSSMRLYRDRLDVVTRGRWHWCPPGALPLPFPHAYGSFTADPDSYEYKGGVGEIPQKMGRVRAPENPRYLGQNYCGSIETWLNGALYSQRGTPAVDDEGVPICCEAGPPIPGGADAGGVASWPVIVLTSPAGGVGGATPQTGNSIGFASAVGALAGSPFPADPEPVRSFFAGGAYGGASVTMGDGPIPTSPVGGIGGGSASVETEEMPSGTIVAFGGSAAPAGWLLCDGSDYTTAAFPDLSSALAGAWDTFRGVAPPAGGSFRVPDLRGLVLLGVGSAGSNPTTSTRALADADGEEDHQLITAELASHAHTITDMGHNHTSGGFLNNFLVTDGTTELVGVGADTVPTPIDNGSDSVNNNVTNITIDAAGSDTPHNTMQPFAAITWIIKT